MNKEQFDTVFDTLYPAGSLSTVPVMQEAFREVAWNVYQGTLDTNQNIVE